ncbi:MAG: hypothetical protein ACK456_17835 [Pseudanabaenaceae cyanobacterium]
MTGSLALVDRKCIDQNIDPTIAPIKVINQIWVVYDRESFLRFNPAV